MKMDGINKFVQMMIKNRQRVIAAVASLVCVFGWGCERRNNISNPRKLWILQVF